MPIEFQCPCGKKVRAPDTAAGKKARCPKCGETVTIPAAPPPTDEYDLAPVESPPPPWPRPAATPVAVSADKPQINPYAQLTPPPQSPGIVRRFMYLVLLLGLIPLIAHTIHESRATPDDRDDAMVRRIEETIKAHPELPDLEAQVVAKIEKLNSGEAEFDDVLNALPGHKLDGAYLARDTNMHWAFAGIAAVGYLAILLAMFPGAAKRALWLFLSGLFTGTIGILLLLGFQYAAEFSSGIGFHGGGKTALILLIVRLIGLSYSLALQPDTGLFLSFIGFTCGVGLCEEVTKAIPLLFRVKDVPGQADAKWNDLLLIGLASGFGFGIAEAIMYSHRYYNGIESASIYQVRFISCVVLHAIWAGAIGVTLHNRKDWLKTDNWWAYWGHVVLIVLVPMVLHGLYDTLLKKEYNAVALAVAVASFGWLAFQIERMHRAEPAFEAT